MNTVKLVALIIALVLAAVDLPARTSIAILIVILVLLLT